MLQNTVLRRVRDEFKMAIAVVSSDIAVIILQSERIVYSRFKISLNTTSQSSCAMSKTFDLAELFLIIELIFWDEISMQNRFDVEVVDRIF